MIQIQPEVVQPTSEGPIAHLVACHRRIEQRLEVLERAGALLDDKPRECLLAITNSLRFMDVSGVLHTLDEEGSVFPRIRQAASENEIAYLDRLEAEHQEVDRVYLQLKQVAALLAENVTPELVAEYRTLIASLTALYRAHIASEDDVLVKIGNRLLDLAALEAIQAEMRARRR